MAPPQAALRQEEIKLQVALLTPLTNIEGYSGPRTKAAVERARLIVEQADARGEPPEDPLLRFSTLFGQWAAILVSGFDADVCLELASNLLALAEKQGVTAALLIAHRIMGQSLVLAGKLAAGRKHYDSGLALYDPAEHRKLATRFTSDSGVAFYSHRSWVLFLLGYPASAVSDVECALTDARAVGHTATLTFALSLTGLTRLWCGDYRAATAQSDEIVQLAGEKGATFWKALGLNIRGCVLTLTAKSFDAINFLTSARDSSHSLGATLWYPYWSSMLATAYADISKFDDARRCIGEALLMIQRTKERWAEAEVNRIAGEIALKSPEQDTASAETYFERALAVARQQQAKSWELRAAMSMARLWRDQGKRDEARELLAPVYGWFTEGFDTRDLKDAKTLLDALSS